MCRDIISLIPGRVEKTRADTGTQLPQYPGPRVALQAPLGWWWVLQVCTRAPAAEVIPVMAGNGENFVGSGWSALPVKLELSLGDGRVG